MSKRKALQRHARRRAAERYGINLGPVGRRSIVAAIQNGRSRVVRRSSLRVVVHDVEFDGSTIRVAYDNQRSEIITFLTLPRHHN